jgi:hypothetical protein
MFQWTLFGVQLPEDAGLAQWNLDLVNVIMSAQTELTDALGRQIGTQILGGFSKPTYKYEVITTSSRFPQPTFNSS